MGGGRSIAGKIKINSYGDLFGGEENEVSEVDLAELHSFKNHPFKVLEDEKMQELVESIKVRGVVVPGVVRAIPEGGYEIISGHRRKRACELAELKTMPVIIKQCSDDEAILAMVDSNLQREEILPSERAFSYKMKFEALSHQGKQSEGVTSTQVGWKLETASLVGEAMGDSKNQVRRYIRLTELLTDFLDMVDDKRLKFNPAVEISYLTNNQQEILLKVMNEENVVPSLAQTQQLKKLSQEQTYTKDAVCEILSSSTDKERKFIIKHKIISRYFPPDTTDEEIESIICTLLDEWQRNGGKS
ncbi:MAG: ParB/RepB/Spo0J family partition protein [Lachnospiraceae bacterium]|nr:ParB/RepB/Spo0J family partition protein [Lachnospiraceae bacterium]